MPLVAQERPSIRGYSYNRRLERGMTNGSKSINQVMEFMNSEFPGIEWNIGFLELIAQDTNLYCWKVL